MKTIFNSLKGISLSILAVTVVTTLSTSVQAAPWRTLPASVCQVYNPGDVKPGQVKYQSGYVKHTDVAGADRTTVYCPIKLDDNSPSTIGVWVNYKQADAVTCWLYSNHYDGYPSVSHSYSTPSGLKMSSYKTITTGHWWSVSALCELGNKDEIHSLNYKKL